MNKIFVLVLELLLLLIIVYLKFFNETTAALIKGNSVFNSIYLYLLFLIILFTFTKFFTYLYSKKNHIPNNQKKNIHFGIDNIAKLLVGIGFIVTIFGALGIDIKSLLTSLSIVAAAIAVISKEFINDYLIGIYFSFARDFEINDYVKVVEQKGTLIEISMLKIKLLNDDDDMVIIPNGKIYTNEIINYTKRDIRLMSIDFQIDIKLVKNFELLEKELVSSLHTFAKYIEEDSYNLKIVEMKKDYLDLKFQYKLKQLDIDLQKKIRKRTVREVFNYVSSFELIEHKNLETPT